MKVNNDLLILINELSSNIEAIMLIIINPHSNLEHQMWVTYSFASNKTKMDI